MMRFWKILYPLLSIALGAGLLLGAAWYFLKTPIAEAAAKRDFSAASSVLTDPSGLVAVPEGREGWNFYAAIAVSGETQGYVFRTSARGYGGEVVCLTGITNGAVDRVAVLSISSETPGIGNRAAEATWLSKFHGRTSFGIPRDRAEFPSRELDAVSGATLTSVAVSKSVFQAFRDYRRLVPLMVLTPRVTNRWGETITNFETNWTSDIDGLTNGGAL